MDPFLEEVKAELSRADENHAPYHSLHEAYAVLLEEVDELWEEVRKKRAVRDPEAIRHELVQIASICWRTSRCVLGKP